MSFEVTILGCSGAIPAYNRHPSAQVLNYNGSLFLIDCGEGTQFQMNAFGIKRGRLDHIFISHLHGDHYFGLVGLITSLQLNRREHPLHIYGNAALEEIINVHLKHSMTQLRFPLVFHPVQAYSPEIIFENSCLTVETLILTHRIPTTGFLFKEKHNLRKMKPEKIQEYAIPYALIPDIKKGADFTDSAGRKIANSELTLPPSAPASYAYCSDTLYSSSFVAQIKDVDLLYHEGTFAEEHEQRAKETFHSTAKQAALTAKAANAQKLIIGHFSARYENLTVLLEQSRAVFPNTYLAEEGKTFATAAEVEEEKTR